MDCECVAEFVRLRGSQGGRIPHAFEPKNLLIGRHYIDQIGPRSPAAHGRAGRCVFCETEFLEALTKTVVIRPTRDIADYVDVIRGADVRSNRIGDKQLRDLSTPERRAGRAAAPPTAYDDREPPPDSRFAKDSGGGSMRFSRGPTPRSATWRCAASSGS